MKKFIYPLILCLALNWSACSVDDVLEPSDKIETAIIETADTVPAVIGEVVNLKFVASTNKGKITRIEIKEQQGEFTPLPEEVTFALVDQELELSINREGQLSRPLNTLMVLYPLQVSDNPAHLGMLNQITFRISSDQGKSAEVSFCFKIVEKSETEEEKK